MVRRQLAARGISDRRVLAALATIPREHFVPEHLLDQACADLPLPSAHGQTISQPYIVALMTQEAALTRRSRVLEVGTGTGYHAAVLANLAGHVWTVERVAELSAAAKRRLSEIGVENVTLVVGDGAEGHAPGAPYDAIVVAAAAPSPPDPLIRQLAAQGRLIIPVGNRVEQHLMVYRRREDGLESRNAGPCRFVPLVSPLAFGAE